MESYIFVENKYKSDKYFKQLENVSNETSLHVNKSTSGSEGNGNSKICCFK